jgi:hypothetical protein
MNYTQQTYDMAVAANAHTGLKKPSFKVQQKLLAESKAKSMTQVEKVTAVMVREVVADGKESNPGETL